MAPWHSAKHQREAWGGIGGAALAPERRWHRPEPAGFLLPWVAHAGRGTLLHLHERKPPRAAGGPTGRDGTGRDGGAGVALAMVLHRPRPCRPSVPPAGRTAPLPLPPWVTPTPGKAGTSEEPGHQAGPELFNVIAQKRVRCLPLFYVLHV